MTIKKLSVLLMITSFLFILSGCAPGSGASTPENPAGFISSIWHGWIAPITLVWGLFNESIRVYEPINTGWWYDFGFYIAIIGGFGSISFFRRQHKDKE